MDVISELLEMNPHWMGDKYDVKSRNVSIKVFEEKITVIQGPRRAGKTYLLRGFINNLISSNLTSEKILYLDLFHPFIIPYNHPKRFIELIKRYLHERKLSFKEVYILIDEIQELKDWEKVVEYLRSKGSKVIITGSNASLLSEEVGYRLVGRYYKQEVYTLSFPEYLRWRNLKSEFAYLHVEDYSFSSFPEYVLYHNKETLTQIFYDILQRDIFWRHNIRDKSKFMDLVSYLMENVGRYITYKSASKVCEISDKVIKEFMLYLENSYLFFFLSRYSKKTAEIIKSPRKVYIIDNSFAILKRRKFLEDKGRYMENVVFMELKRRKNDFYYYQTADGYEVDFLIKDYVGIKELIQVSYDVSDEETLKREIRALLHAKEDLNLSDDVPLTIITWDYEDEKEVEWWRKKGKIRFIPLWKWLLNMR